MCNCLMPYITGSMFQPSSQGAILLYNDQRTTPSESIEYVIDISTSLSSGIYLTAGIVVTCWKES